MTAERDFELELHGFQPATGAPGSDGPGNEAWQRAQRLALEMQSQARRN